MSKIIRSNALLLILAALISGLLPTKAYTAPAVNVTINGVAFSFDTPPVIIEGRTMVPLRKICDVFGIDLYWDEPTKIAYFSSYGVKAHHISNSSRLTINGETRDYQVSSVIINGRIYMPLLMISDMLGADISYVASTNTVAIRYNFGGHTVKVGSKSVTTGDNINTVIKTFGYPQLTAKTQYGFEWYIYNAKPEEFIMIGLQNGLTKAIYSQASSFVYNNTVRFGDLVPTSAKEHVTFFSDANNGSKIYAVYVNTNNFSNERYASNFAAISAAEERIIFELTNIFRYNNGLSMLEYIDKLSQIAKAHSQDMADKDYFNHIDKNEGTPLTRVKTANVFFRSCNENIAAGNVSAVMTFDQWVNAGAHRKTMLSGEFDAMGCGIGYNPTSKYSYYYTQTFISR